MSGIRNQIAEIIDSELSNFGFMKEKRDYSAHITLGRIRSAKDIYKLREMISRMTSNVFRGILTGALMTVVVQSSSVTTVMVVGFLNAALMTLRQAVGVILGAGIGTTLTGWILALEVDKYGLLIIGIGTLTFLFVQSVKIKKRALTAVGVGMIFFGLYIMKSGVTPVKDMPQFISFFFVCVLLKADLNAAFFTFRGTVCTMKHVPDSHYFALFYEGSLFFLCQLHLCVQRDDVCHKKPHQVD